MSDHISGVEYTAIRRVLLHVSLCDLSGIDVTIQPYSTLSLGLDCGTMTLRIK